MNNKKEVLSVLIYKVNQDWSIAQITFQNTNILKRGEFCDDELNVESRNFPAWDKEKKKLYIKGTDNEKDTTPFLVNKEDCSVIFETVRAINNKYGENKSWRGKTGETYYYISSFGEIEETTEDGHQMDNRLYEIGNYFKDKANVEVYHQKFINLFYKMEGDV